MRGTIYDVVERATKRRVAPPASKKPRKLKRTARKTAKQAARRRAKVKRR
jgi:hypothetical protein